MIPFRIYLTPIVLALLVTAAPAAENSLGGAQRPGPAAPPRPPAPMPAPSLVVPFTLDGIPYRFQLPPGFCVPAIGHYALRAAQVAGGDASNVTNVTFNDCASMARQGDLIAWGMVKTPRAMVGTDAGTRESLIALLKAQFADGSFERAMAQGPDTAVKPLGTDAYGAYVGGTMQIQGRKFAAAWSMTAVKHRVLAVYIYGAFRTPADVQTVIGMVRAATAQLVAMNEGR